MSNYINNLEEATQSFVQKLKAEARKKLRELKNPKNITDTASKAVTPHIKSLITSIVTGRKKKK
jgi:hypothetical protein